MINVEMTEAEYQKVIAEMRKLNAEGEKLIQEARLNEKKAKWYELTLFFAAIATTVAVTKIFL